MTVRIGLSGFNVSRNRGIALFISLVLLLILTIIGVSSVQTTTLETRMARNEHDTLLAFQAAELALRDAEIFIETIKPTTKFSDTGAGGLWTVAPLGQPNRWESEGVWGSAKSVAAATNAGAVVAEPPRYLIEHVASVVREDNAYLINDPYTATVADRIEVYRITARGVGGTGNAQVLLQSTYGRIVN
jgi:type IV pilus assembly protein PilX